MIQKSTRSKVNVTLAFKDVDDPKTLYSVYSILPFLFVDGMPLTQFVDVTLWASGEELQDYFAREFVLRSKTYQLVPVEKCAWVFKRTGSVQEITNEKVIAQVWETYFQHQNSYPNWSFNCNRTITVSKKSHPCYPFKVTFDPEKHQLTYIYPTKN
jgi:hypothetical protein